MTIQITHRYTGEVLCEGDAQTLKEFVEAQVAEGVDLSYADFRGANLRCIDLIGAIMPCADFRGADMRCSNMSCAIFAGADMRGAKLSGADMRGAILRGVRLAGACIAYAKLSIGGLSGVDFRDDNLAVSA